MEEKDLIKRAKNGDELSLEILMDNYKNLVAKIARRFFIIGADFNDVIQEGMIGLFNAYNKYDESKNTQFKTFATLCITRQILTAITKANKNNKNDLLDDISMDVFNNNSIILSPEDDIIFNEEYNNLLLEISKILSDKEQTILNKFLDNKSYEEIASELNITKKSVDNALTRIRNKLKYLNK